MQIEIFETKQAMGQKAAADGAEAIRRAIFASGEAAIVTACAASQFEMIEALAAEPIDWSRVTLFHLDEYIGLPATHPASFRKFLRDRLLALLPVAPKTVHLIRGEAADSEEECRRLGALISAHAIDAAFIGIGENGHLAFNDPPADFQTERPYLVVELDEVCRRQQLGEGWFPTMDDIPRRAISMSVRQILKARTIVCTVPDRRKAEAVRAAVEGPVTAEVPASILQRHDGAVLYLDRPAASLLKG